VDGASDLEALFASWEEAKPPNILATVAGLNKKRKRLALKPPIKKKKPRFSSKRSPPFLTYAFSFSS